MNGMERAAFSKIRRYSGNVEVLFLDAVGWSVEAIVRTPIGEVFYVANISPENEGDPSWTPRLLDNVAKVFIGRAIDDDTGDIRVERFSVFVIDEAHRHLGETLYVGRSRETRWPPASAGSPA